MKSLKPLPGLFRRYLEMANRCKADRKSNTAAIASEVISTPP
ncbi:hypothetical protein [Roseofilum casamattae]|uniref:Uncharacterized protein n=1 Tax=Roseofilum casamattae BLCC-M143 TaxID=3022442 RepID=A0ABT7BRY5_9CYAN|nr:hypothetical protein [Roseofilum casamattae]MDJ1181951.1 hypothetical protein [Roseofilum casamattae BLCC-M143]